MLILETKGQDPEQDQVKRRYLDEWTQARLRAMTIIWQATPVATY
jgi:hypothetical protein